MNARQARNVPATQILAAFGFQPQKENEREAWYRSPLRAAEQTASFKVCKRKNLWFDHGIGQGGNAIDLACRLYGVRSIAEVLGKLADTGLASSFHPRAETQTPSLFTAPNPTSVASVVPPAMELIEARELEHPALRQYLQQRGIDLAIAARYLREVHYRLRGRRWFALGFPNDDGGFELRNPWFQGCLAPKTTTWFRRGADALVVFEGFFDFLSWLTLAGRAEPDRDVLVLNSLAFCPRVQPQIAAYARIELYLDSDPAGREARRFFPGAIDRAPCFAPAKDLNDWLCANLRKDDR